MQLRQKYKYDEYRRETINYKHRSRNKKLS